MTDNKVELTLPMPPTDNRYYGKPKGSRHKYLTKSAKIFRYEVSAIVFDKGLRGLFGKKRVGIKVVLHLASGGDIFNRMKGLGDALQYANIIDDDKQIDVGVVIRGHRVRGGRCDLTIWEK